MRSAAVLSVLAVVSLSAPASGWSQTPTGAPVTLKAPDGVSLKATYFSPGRPGPGIMLLHQCNRDRTSWTALATEAAARGFHVLTLDYRGFGESGGEQFGSYQEQQPVVAGKWPGDIDAAFTWLIQQEGVDRNRIGAAGASCGVNQSLLLARRHPEVKTVVLLSGGATPEAREHLRQSPGMPVLAAASLDDGSIVSGMRWILGWSRNDRTTFLEFQAAGHGTDMFEVEPELKHKILGWFDANLRHAPAALPAAPADSEPTVVEKFWTALTKPGGVDRARQIYEDSKRRDPGLVLFPETEANTYGYQLLQSGSVNEAIAVFALNVDAYPKSANTYDSLSDAHLAAGNRDEALRLAEKALAMLEQDTRLSEELRSAIMDSAEKKIKELRGKEP